MATIEKPAQPRGQATEQVSISVPKALRARMRKHREIRWSAVACEAFEALLAKLEGGKET